MVEIERTAVCFGLLGGSLDHSTEIAAAYAYAHDVVGLAPVLSDPPRRAGADTKTGLVALLDAMTSSFEAPSRRHIRQRRAWLMTVELPDPPVMTMPGVEAWSPELTRRQLLAESFSESGPQRAVLEGRCSAARYGPQF